MAGRRGFLSSQQPIGPTLTPRTGKAGEISLALVLCFGTPLRYLCSTTQNPNAMVKDLFNKYIWLVDTIYRSRSITFEEINERWQRSSLSEGEPLPRRTFHNWRTAIEQVFDINIGCRRKGGYRYYIEHADDMERGGVRNWLLNTFAVNNLINESHHLKRRILFEQIPSGRKHLTPIIEAMRDSLELRINYQGFWADEPSAYTLRPYCVKVFRQRWYVLGYCLERDALRIFALDRIHGLQATHAKFKYPKDFNPEAYFADSFGITVGGEEPEMIELKVYSSHRDYIRALPLHTSQHEVETADDYSVFAYFMRPTLDFMQEILSRGAEVEVLRPAALREAIGSEILEMERLYNPLQNDM